MAGVRSVRETGLCPEKLGIIFARADGTFAAVDCDKLVLPSSKRMVWRQLSPWDVRWFYSVEVPGN
jgi:hypothetical protein